MENKNCNISKSIFTRAGIDSTRGKVLDFNEVIELSDEEFNKYLRDEQLKAGCIRMATPEDVDFFRKMLIQEMYEYYSDRLYIIEVLGVSSVRDIQLLIIMERELYIRGSDEMKKKFKKKFWEMVGTDHTAETKAIRGG